MDNGDGKKGSKCLFGREDRDNASFIVKDGWRESLFLLGVCVKEAVQHLPL
jgi:hypothetical protein